MNKLIEMYWIGYVVGALSVVVGMVISSILA